MRSEESIDEDIHEVLGPRAGDPGGADGLPYQLGLSARVGARWSDFIQLPPNRDLPSWVADDAGIDASVARAFDRAHHLAAAWGVVADRIDDGQVRRPDRFAEVRGRLLDAWRAALGDACGGALAVELVDQSLDAWREGTAIERSLLGRPGRAEAPGDYFRAVRLRLRWVSTSAVAMLRSVGDLDRASRLERAYATFLCGLQCRDDFVDADDDRAIRGASTHEALGVPRGALLRVAPRALCMAAEACRQAAFDRLAAWIAGFAREVDVRSRDGSAAQDGLAGFVLTAALEEISREDFAHAG